MTELGLKCKVYYKHNCIGELDIVDVQSTNFKFPNNEIIIDHLSLKSNRCSPHSVAHSIASSSVLCKLESSDEHSELYDMYIDCIKELKTGVVLLGEEEVHLVAMVSKYRNCACFWCYAVPSGLYSVCLRMLDLRCLWIVLDLDETLIVGNTMKSFNDRIASLRRRIARETDPVRKAEIFSEMVLYEEDQRLLKQYIDRDSVVENGNVYNVQAEVVTICESQKRIVRPVIRLLDKSIVLTRINPEIRDTSVLVRLRPAWEDLRRHLHSKERKRFEVYVCTMAERYYALEMWRLLDPEAHLIDPKQISDRVICVKSGSRKSLHSVFQDKKFHSEMTMVIDDRLKVWEDVDQPRVQVVPAFSPYRAPQADIANGVPVLCVARNVACNVRGCFFKEFDENLSERVSGLFYEGEVKNLPSPPDVTTYLMAEIFEMANNTNHFSLRSILEKDKLTGTNFLDWQRNLRIVLRQERKLYVIDIPRPGPLPEGATEDQRNAYQKHLDDDTDVTCLMLATMSPELQKQHENFDSYIMIEHLKRMFEGQARQERFDTSKALYACKQGERDPVAPHVLKMIGYMEYLATLGSAISPEAQIDLILQSLNSSYAQFVMNYNMNEIDKNPTELLAMLKTSKTNIQKASSAPIMMVNKGNAKGKGKWKGKKKIGSKSAAGPKPAIKKALKPKGGVEKAKGECHYCKKPGHWKRNCQEYLDGLKKLKAVQIFDSGTSK